MHGTWWSLVRTQLAKVYWRTSITLSVFLILLLVVVLMIGGSY